MKKKTVAKIVLSVIFVCIAVYGVCSYQQSNVVSDLMLANIEALARGESDCHNINGYVAFTRRSGGAYDCCNVWVSRAPNTKEGRCR